MSRSNSFSSIEESTDTKTKMDDLPESDKTALKTALKSLKQQNPKAKKVVIKGQSHQSSTVPTHSNVLSVQLRDANEQYLGSSHVDVADGTAYPNDKWKNNAPS